MSNGRRPGCQSHTHRWLPPSSLLSRAVYQAALRSGYHLGLLTGRNRRAGGGYRGREKSASASSTKRNAALLETTQDDWGSICCTLITTICCLQWIHFWFINTLSRNKNHTDNHHKTLNLYVLHIRTVGRNNTGYKWRELCISGAENKRKQINTRIWDFLFLNCSFMSLETKIQICTWHEIAVY